MANARKSETWQLGHALSHDALPSRYRDWLLDAGSLTKRLRQLTEGRITFSVQQNGWGQPTPEECSALKLPDIQSAWLREIDWVYEQNLWVKGRVVIPSTSFVGEGKRLQSAGGRPIGDILFSDPQLQRSEFDVASLLKSHFYYQLVSNELSDLPDALWARRSIFYFYGKPLLVSEIFLPAIFGS